MSTGPIIMIGVLMAIANAAYPAEIIGANACRRARSLARGCRTGSRADTMHPLTPGRRKLTPAQLGLG